MNAQEHIQGLLQGLHPRQVAAMACFSAERVFPVYEATLDGAPLRELLNRAWEAAEGRPILPEELKDLEEAALAATPDTQEQPHAHAAHAAACAVVGALGAERSAKDAAFAAVSALEATHIRSGLPRRDLNYRFPLTQQMPAPVQKEYEAFLAALNRVRQVDPTSLNKYVFAGLIDTI